jgi:hypothetical protein
MEALRKSWVDRFIWGWSRPQTIKFPWGGSMTTSIMTKRWYHWWMDDAIYKCPEFVDGRPCYYRLTSATFLDYLHCKLFGYTPKQSHEHKPKH